MLVKQQAIVLHSFPYGDNSRIVKCYTLENGLQSYLVNGVNNKKGVLKPAMVFPLTQLEIVAYIKGKGGLERIKEARLTTTYRLIPKDPYRNALALFLAEILSQVTREEHPNKSLFQYLINTFNQLDNPDQSIKNFHVEFLSDLSFYLGFKPSSGKFNNGYFDMMEGTVSASKPLHPYYMDKEISALLAELINQKVLQCSKENRILLL